MNKQTISSFNEIEWTSDQSGLIAWFMYNGEEYRCYNWLGLNHSNVYKNGYDEEHMVYQSPMCKNHKLNEKLMKDYLKEHVFKYPELEWETNEDPKMIDILINFEYKGVVYSGGVYPNIKKANVFQEGKSIFELKGIQDKAQGRRLVEEYIRETIFKVKTKKEDPEPVKETPVKKTKRVTITLDDAIKRYKERT